VWFGVLALSCACTNAHRDPQTATVTELLAEGDRLAWLTDWHAAQPFYANAERAAREASDERNAMYAKFGRLRGQMESLALSDVSDQLSADLATPLAKSDARLQLRGLTVKGDIDLEWDVEAAQRDWEQVRQVAQGLGDKVWANRATGELGMVAFMRGNIDEARNLVERAFQAARWSGDVGAQLRYAGAIANGSPDVRYQQRAVNYSDKAIAFARRHPAMGFPYVAYNTKVLTLLRMKSFDEAEQLAHIVMHQANEDGRSVKQVESLMMLAKVASQRGQHVQETFYLEQAARIAHTGHIPRLLGHAEDELAKAYREGGDLAEAARHIEAAVKDTRSSGNRFLLPRRLAMLADLYAGQGKVAAADRTYQEAADLVEANMIDVPTSTARARQMDTMNVLYMSHVHLAVTRRDADMTYRIIERARGRAIADVLRALPDRSEGVSRRPSVQMRAVSRLQIQLIEAQTPPERTRLLEQLWEAEQALFSEEHAPSTLRMVGRSSITLKVVQNSLRADETILAFVLDEPASACLVITNREARLISLTSRKQIEELADRFRDSLRSLSGEHVGAADALRGALLEPLALPTTARRLYVVPDGRLHLIPFDALLDVNFDSDRSVTIVPSASVLHLLRTTPTRHEPRRLLLAVGGVPYGGAIERSPATAPVRPDQTRGFYDVATPWKLEVLASSEAEVAAAAALLGGDSVVLKGDHAREATLNALTLSDFRILHFAVHGITDPKYPERAALVLLADPHAGEDGLLQPREIGALALSADLVVLSACDTAVGPMVGQEGTLNLARAFLLAGARAVITTLWTVSDATSTALMTRFYENLASGRSVTQALATAKRAVFQRFGPQAAPTLAAFHIVGDGERLTARRPHGARSIKPPSLNSHSDVDVPDSEDARDAR
jgi:CHAT domain-containing protein/Tfp pilus assembly protein PilF